MQLHLIIKGRVQGVNFRSFLKERADASNITGWVGNNPDGTVELIAEGNKEDLLNLLQACKAGPRKAQVQSIIDEWTESSANYTEFIIKS